ncbi:hypothetical protein [Mycobacteroides abscessus]|uniref:hypothetical protein n=1 Tax=Mycobacteroides abscessus TaxID=36809 RepID=UPI00104CEDD8|nr:hypothetical protein [Mycobacteroides abscessus]
MSAADSTLGITCGLVSEFLWGAAACAAKAVQRLAEHRIARRTDEFIDLGELFATASPDELAAMAGQRARVEDLVDAPVSHADLAACITRVWVGGTHLGYIWADPIASSLLADYRITKK